MTEPADKTIHVEPSARTYVDWTPRDIRQARLLADAGTLSHAADLCEHMMGDDRVAAALRTRCNGLVALPLTFEPARGGKRAVRALEAGEDWWAAFPESSVSQLLAWGVLLGVGIAQVRWTDRGSTINRIVPVLEVWHPRHLRWDWNQRAWFVRIAAGTEIQVTPGDGKWILYTPYGAHRPWAHGAWRAIASWSLLKQFAISDWGRYSEQRGQGTFVAEAPEGGSKDARREVANELQAIGRDTAIALPAGFKIQLVEAVANTWQTFEAQKNAADLGTSVAILGQNLSTEVSGPVSTGATLHGRVMQTYIEADAATLSTCLHDQALVWWAELNFASRDLAPWPKWNTTPPADKKQNAEVLKTVADSLNTLGNAGAPVDVRALLEAYGVPLKDVEDIEQAGQVFKYHLDYGVLTLNEIRARLGLPKVAGGDVAPKAVAAAGGGEDGASEKALDGIVTRAGRLVRKSGGLLQGQLYADAVADTARDRAAKVLDEDLVAVLEAIEGGTSYEDIRARLLKTYRGMSPDKVAKLVEAAFTMAELGGRHAVLEDT